MRRSIAGISSGLRGIGRGVAVGGEKHPRVVAGGAAVVRATMACAGIVAAVTAAGPAGAQPPVPFSLRLEVNGSIPSVAVAPGQVVVRRGLFGRPRAVVVPGPVAVPGAVAVPVPPFGFPGIPLPPWVVFNGGEIIVETTPPDVVVPGLPEAAPAQPADPAAAPSDGAAPPAEAAPQPADPPANPAAPGLGAKPRAGGPAPQVARATPAKTQRAPVAATPRAGAAAVAAKPARAGEAIAAPLPKPAAGGVIAARPVPAAATPFTREWFAARPDAWRPEATAADWWRPADVAALTAWIAAGAAQAGSAPAQAGSPPAQAGSPPAQAGGKPAEAGGVSAAGGAAAEADGLKSVLVLPTGGDEPAAGAAEWLPLGVFAVVPPGGTSEASQQILFVDHSGAIRGNFHDPLSDTVQPVSGDVDLAAGRASWTVGAAGSRFECPLTEFTAFPGKVSVTAGGRVRVLDIVPIPAP